MSTRLGFIGAGGVANWQHFDNLETLDRAEVVAVCDVDEAAATAAADRFDATAYADHHNLYDDAAVDAVFVCLPPFAHDGQEVAAAQRGIDLFVEKPLGLAAETAHEARAAIEEAGVIAQVGYNWRYSRGVERARELLADRAVGYVDGHWWGGVPGGADHWWRHVDRSGGQIVEQATHAYDAVRYLAGDVDRVWAAGETRISDLVDFPDVTSATMEHASGAVSHVSTSCVAETEQFGLDVVADGATLEVHQDRLEGVLDGEEIRETFDENPYALEVASFLKAVETRDRSLVRAPYADAVRSFELTLAATEAIERERPVEP